MSVLFDTEATRMAERLTAWMQTRVDPSRVEWTMAFRAELDDIDGGWRKLRWAIGGLSLLWSFRRYRAGYAWEAASPRVLARAAYQRRGEALAFSTTLALVGLLAFVIVVVVPFFRNAGASVGFRVPMPSRLALGLLQIPLVWWSLPLAVFAYALRMRRWHVGRVQFIRGLSLLNVLIVAFLLSYGTFIVDFAVGAHEGAVFRTQRLANLRTWENAVVRQVETEKRHR